MQYKKLWIALGVVMVVSSRCWEESATRQSTTARPSPPKSSTADGRVLFTGETIRDGQNVWQSIGGQEIGTIWGHGAYVAPDWSADYLHRAVRLRPRPLGQAAGSRQLCCAPRRTASRVAGAAYRSHSHAIPTTRRRTPS